MGDIQKRTNGDALKLAGNKDWYELLKVYDEELRKIGDNHNFNAGTAQDMIAWGNYRMAIIKKSASIIPELKTWSCGGGEVDYRVTSSGLVLIDARPAAGFTVSEKKAKGDEITVKFIPNAKNDERKSSLKIKKSRIVSTSCEDKDFDRRSDSEDSGSTNNNDESADD